MCQMPVIEATILPSGETELPSAVPRTPPSHKEAEAEAEATIVIQQPESAVGAVGGVGLRI